MNKVFVVLAVFVACTLASKDSYQLTDLFCGLSGSGTATITGVPTSVKCTMIRVKNTVRYDFLNADQSVLGTIISRPDLGSTFYYMPSLPQQCYTDYYVLGLDKYYYDYDYENDEYDRYCVSFLYGVNLAEMYVKDGSLEMESLLFPDVNVVINITYDEMNYLFEHPDIDNAFSLKNDNCPAVESNATKARTSMLCVSVPFPDNACSFSGNGTATISCSTWKTDVSCDVKMHRVGGCVRYDLFGQQTQDYIGTFLGRYDQYNSYLYLPGHSICDQISGDESRLPTQFVEITDDNLDYFGPYENRYALFDHTSHDLVSEYYNLEASTAQYTLTFTFTSIDHSYVRETDDDMFILDVDQCPDDSHEKPKYAKTSIQCSAKKVVYPVVPGCLFTYKLKMGGYYAFYDVSFDVRVMLKDDKPYFLYLNSTVMTMTVRCDMRSKGQCRVAGIMYDYGENGSDSCEDDEYMDLEDIDDFYPFSAFEYTGEPEDVLCPDNVSKCKKYCDYSDDGGEDICGVLDKDGYLVQSPMYIVTYSESVPTVDDFKFVKCDGEIIPLSEELCVDNSSDSSNNPSDSSNNPSHSSNNPSHSSNNPSNSNTLSSGTFTIPSILLIIAVAFLLSLF